MALVDYPEKEPSTGLTVDDSALPDQTWPVAENHATTLEVPVVVAPRNNTGGADKLPCSSFYGGHDLLLV